MVGLLYFYPSFDSFDRARNRLYEKWRTGVFANFAIRVYEFKLSYGYALVVFPLNDGTDPSRFIHAVQAILGDADRMVESLRELPSNKAFIRAWMTGQDSLLTYLEGGGA